MSVQIFALDKVSENELIETVKKASDDDPNFVTAINDREGAFSVESTFISDDGAAASGATITLNGKMSHFGGPNDHGVKPDEDLAIMDRADVANNSELFLATQPAGTTGTARRLNPDAKYIACRWDYNVTPKTFLKMITVKVSANEKTFDARPVDWGPNVKTGRIADLSPGLESELGLTTDQQCQVEIPTPAGASVPAAGDPVDAQVIPRTFDSSIFPQDMTRTLVVMTLTDKATYWVTNLTGPNEGGQTLLRHAGNQTDILLSDTVVLPVKASDQIPAAVADELNKAVPEQVASDAGSSGNLPQPGDDISAKVFQKATGFVNHDTSHVPDTDGGNLACAWAVNEVVRQALGKPISGTAARNGLSTIGISEALQAHHTRLNSAADAQPGTIIIAPTQGANHGHVGIVGSTPGGVDATQVFSNSSSHKEFEQNYTIESFTNRYRGKHLQVLLFKLNVDFFA